METKYTKEEVKQALEIWNQIVNAEANVSQLVADMIMESAYNKPIPYRPTAEPANKPAKPRAPKAPRPKSDGKRHRADEQELEARKAAAMTIIANRFGADPFAIGQLNAGLSAPVDTATLKRLVADGKLVMEGERRFARYRVTGK